MATLDKGALLDALEAVRNGDFSVRLPRDWAGVDGKIADAFNDIVATNQKLAGAIEQVSVAVGTEGRLGRRMVFDCHDGAWGSEVNAINSLIDNLVQPVLESGRVIGAVARGMLGDSMALDIEGRPLQGEFLKNAQTINTMLAQLIGFSDEVTRVAREVGTEGKLGGQAQVAGASGVWKDLTDNVNLMANNLTAQVRNIAQVTTAVARGDLSRKITVDVKGEILELKDTINTMVDQLNGFAGEVTRVAREVGTEGKLGGQAQVVGASGVWKDLTDNVNLMANNLTAQVRNIAQVTTAVARGDLSRKITVDVKGEILELKDTINTMVDQLNSFAGEVTRVAREVGTEGRLGGQAQVPGVAGVWKELTVSVNLMAENLTEQVRGIAKVVTGVAAGDLKQKMTVPAKGEIASLAETVNDMVGTLATFSEQVTHVAREVGVEGRLGGQAVVPGATGSWKELVDNVNELAANLTTQVRAIGEVATAVTKGDLTRTIQVAARGEVAYLKDNINQMIQNLKETTERNTEQDWLKTNLAHVTRMLQGQRDIVTVSRLLLSELAPLVSSQHAVLYLMQAQGDGSISSARLTLMASYGYQERKNLSREWTIGEGLVGQAAFEKQRIMITDLPEDYVRIASGLGQAAPRSIVVLPILFEGHVKAVIELASFERFQPVHLNFLDQLAEGLGIVFNSIESASGTEALLRQAQSLASELKSRQDELQNINAELEQKAQQLSEQNAEVESKNREIEVARSNLQEKAEQLALTSKYKSEFLANMSHELRTPLNSLLLLAEQLRQNRAHNLSDKQLEMVRIIHDSGSDLLRLINDILDLSKIESGNVTPEIEDVPCSALVHYAQSTFSHLAQEKGLALRIDFAPDFPSHVRTDEQRLKLVLRNLLANAIKFTGRGSVELSGRVARSGWNREHRILNQAPSVLAFAVRDTGIGIAPDKQKLIFEAFQQADSSTSRSYGGTGLGLAISREVAQLLGGELKLESEEGVGSAFTFYLPQNVPGFLELRAVPPEVQHEAAAETRVARSTPRPPQRTMAPSAVPAEHDDRALVTPQDALLLIIEDDPVFAHALRDMAHDTGFKALLTSRGEEGLELARQFRPDAITLDLILPDSDGWEIARRLKAGRQTRDIPVHVMSVRDRPTSGPDHGIASYSPKPVDVDTLSQVFARITDHLQRPVRALLVVETDPARREAIMTALQGGGVLLDSASSAAEALTALHSRAYQGIVLDLDLPDMDGITLLREIRADPVLADIPAVIYTARGLDSHTEETLHQLDAAVVAEGAPPLDRLRLQTTQFLQWVRNKLPVEAGPLQQQLQQPEEQDTDQQQDLAGRAVLVVDDDIRNLFALTGLLESHGLSVASAKRGAEAIARLQQEPPVDLVLMDIMMPEMDGYETIRQIRGMPQFARLPIIALTAKAMVGDSDKCLAAGASDYASKPVDSEQLLTQLRKWLRK